jgi:hypothetical protein
MATVTSTAKAVLKPKQEEPCTACFEDGWPAGATGVGCEHGTWARELPEPDTKPQKPYRPVVDF